ncbi:MAG TPA: nicotinate phosphoribosyltransferase [Spirochaetaceae bacterium]|nr:nicotinate phosphoribosyltransferase [Spirochaetaceae bacterium]
MRKTDRIGLFTDYYELLMAQGVFFNGNPECEFYAFYRNNPRHSAYSILSGISELLEDIADFRFSQDDISYLSGLGVFRKEFLKYLEGFSFSGEILSFRDGDVIFPYEPVLIIRGTFCECALLETFVLNCLNFPSCVATKAARVVESAKGKPVFEFAPRRAPFLESANCASYSAYLGGCCATSNTLAGRIYDIPVFGTMAHSWIMNFDSESDAFLSFYGMYPDNCTFLIDTFDTLKSGIFSAMKVGAAMRKDGKTFNIRIDSGDLSYLAKECRRILDSNGFLDTKICLSNDLDESIISQLYLENTPADSFGVGTKLVNQSSLGFVYKLSRISKNGRFVNRMKISSSKEKMTLPGSFQVHRFYGKDGIMCADMIESVGKFAWSKQYLLHHPVKDEAFVLKDFDRCEEKLVQRVFQGNLTADVPTATQCRDFCRNALALLHDSHKRLLNPHIYKVSLGECIKAERESIVAGFK